MKKLLNSKFLLILALSISVLIILTVGAIYLFDNSDDTFVKSGYVLNPMSEKVEKYFFNENTPYHTNLSSMVEFNDVDNKDVSVLKDSFLHYMDNSLSFLKNGAILDLNSIKGKDAVTFYNITNKSIIDKDGNGYVIKNNGSDIKLNNFMGRISDNKYIVVGDVKTKIPGNSSLVEGDYFEIVYVEEGIVNIENKEVKYQVAADGTIMYVGNLVIDFGNKKISKDDEDIMSITAITIDGDENIEIIPKAPDDDSKDNQGNNGTNNGQDGNGQGNGNGGNNGNSDNQGGNNGGNDNPSVNPGEVTDEVIVSLKDAVVGSTSVSLVFDIINQKEDDTFMLKVTNIDTGRTIDMVAEVVPDAKINVSLLSPQTKYLFTVVDNKTGDKYFQKIFETTDFGINLTRNYATDSSLSYKIKIDENTDITNAKLSLYKFNEETMQNEIVKTSYVDSASGEVKYIDKVVWLKDIDKNTQEVVFDGLDSDTIYTAVLDEFSVASSNFKDIYNITLTSLTLKKTPTFTDMVANKDMAKASFKLSLENIIDEDNAIVSYTYLIYENDNSENTAIAPIKKTNASPIEIRVGDNENELKSDTNYYYQVVIEYFDNEKYVEYMTSDRINFVMGSDPLITVVPQEELISYNSIGATITLTDTSCLIGMPNRSKCATDTSSTIVTVKKNSVTGEIIVFSKIVNFDVLENEIKYDLFVDGLEEGSLYSIEVSAIRSDTGKRDEIMHSDTSQRTIKTKTLSSFVAIYPEEDKLTSSANHVVNQRVKLEASSNNTGTLTPEESAKAIKKVVISLYEGNHVEDIKMQDPLVAPKVFYNSEAANLAEMFYNNYYQITTDGTFGLDIDKLKELSSTGKLNPYYTIMIRAYYDVDEVNEVKIENNVMSYQILESLLLENVEDPIIITKEIKHSESGKVFSNLKDNGTVVGYSVNAVYDRRGLVANGLIPKNINIYVYDSNKQRVKFYIKNKNGSLELVDKITDSIEDLQIGNYVTEIFMDYGIEYGSTDNIMRRGNSYYIGYEIDVDTENGSIRYPSNMSTEAPSDYGVYEKVKNSIKETPNVKMYIAKSDSSSITYNYEIIDPDKALYRENSDSDYGLYYKINDVEELKLKITNTEANTYTGSVTIPGLKKNDVYSLYYKKNITNTGNIDEDVVNYLNEEDSGERLFDGYYKALDKDSNNNLVYNFKYEIINNPLTDNKVIFKILTNDELLKRTISYKIHFTDSKGNTLDKEVWSLNTCSEEDEDKRCFYVDYVDLKNAGMKSDKNSTNNISVSVEAYYDNGLTGFEVVPEKYEYMIFQNNSTKEEIGKYLIFNNSGKLALWSEELNIPMGYYTYTLNNSMRTSIYYKSAYNTNHKGNINNITLSPIGYTSSYGVLNPKMIARDIMVCDSNTFSFSSITPKVKTSTKTGLINGSVQLLTLSGVDLEDIKNDGTDKNPEYYLYIDVWNNRTSAVNKSSDVVRPRLKVALSNNNPNATLQAVIDGLEPLPDGEYYYYNVYAYMYKNGKYEFTQLFDEGIRDSYQSKTYQFGTRSGTSLYTNREISYEVSEEVYGDRLLNTKINLTAYQDYPYNFDLMYMICEDNTCTKDEGYIFKKVVPQEEVKSAIISKEDISKYDLEYNKEYYIYIYGITLLYEKNGTGFNETEQYINMISARDIKFKLTALREPSFVVERKAGNQDDTYYIDFKINVNDPDRTLIKGKYFIKLMDTAGNVVGTLQEVDDDGNYITIDNYQEHEFDATILNKKIRITNLDSNTKYSVVVYNDAYINNYSEEIPKEDRTYEIKKSHTIYTTDIYGITFGKDKDISYSINDNSYIVLFRSGTNFDNVVKVNYSVSLDDEFNPGLITSGSDVIGEEHKFEFNDESGYGMYIINRTDGIKNEEGKYYLITLSFEVKDPNDPENTVVLTAAYNSRFTESVIYIKDVDNNK